MPGLQGNRLRFGKGTAGKHRHIRCMLWTSLPAASIAVLTFAGLGLAGVSSGTLASSGAALIKSELVGVFDLGPLAALPLLVALVGIALRKPPALVILASSLLALIVGTALACTFVIIVAGIMYALVFVTQPVNQQAPNDKAFIEQVLVPIVLFLSGALSGVLAANGLSNKAPKIEEDTDVHELA